MVQHIQRIFLILNIVQHKHFLRPYKLLKNVIKIPESVLIVNKMSQLGEPIINRTDF